MSKKEIEKDVEKEAYTEKDYLKTSKRSRRKKGKKFKLSFISSIFIIFFFIIFFIYIFFIYYKNKKKTKFNVIIENENITTDLFIDEIEEKDIVIDDEFILEERPLEKRKYDYENTQFKIIYKKKCPTCGFFTYYINFLGCIITSISSQRTPIIDVRSYPNIFNEYISDNHSLKNGSNYWENIFYHPHNYTLKEIEEKAQKLEYEECENNNMAPNQKEIYYNKYTIEFYHNFAKQYLPIKNEIIKEAYIMKLKLFKKKNNILGVLARGTDVITLKPEDVPIPPTAEVMIEDVKKLDNENNYDYIFLVTEDEIIRNKFIKQFGDKLKYLEPENKIEYHYKVNETLCSNKNVQGFKYQKFYLINIIILSKCIDIISAQTYGAAAAFILSEGFRNSYVYNTSIKKNNA